MNDHPAVKAWRRAQPGRPVPTSIDELKTKRKSQVFRLHGVGEGGRPVIAKRCAASKVAVEQIVYEEIIPRLGLPQDPFYGSVHDESGESWLLIHDVGDLEYSHTDATHRAAVAEWLGALHSFPVGREIEARLPDRGALCCWERMEQARINLEASRSNTALTRDDWKVLQAIIDQLETVKAHWDGFVKLAARLPRTLTHGDLQGRHLRIRADGDSVVLQTFDWEHAGVGFPGVDVRWFAQHWETSQLETYAGALSARWPDLRLDDVRQMIDVGRVFRHMSKIFWSSTRLTDSYVERGVEELRIYESSLADVLREARWVR